MFECFFPIPHFVPNNKIDGQTYRVLDLLQRLHLSVNEVDKLFYSFIRFNPDEEGYIDIDFMFRTWKLEPTPFLLGMFYLFEPVMMPNRINFQAFLLTIYNFLTLDEDEIVDFIFFIFDVKSKRQYTRYEIIYIFKCLWSEKSFKKSKFVGTNIEKMKFSKFDEATVSNIVETICENPILMLVVFQTQELLKKTLWGNSFWKSIKRKRNKNFKQLNIFSICPDYIDESLRLMFIEYLSGIIALPPTFSSNLFSLKQELKEKRKDRPIRPENEELPNNAVIPSNNIPVKVGFLGRFFGQHSKKVEEPSEHSSIRNSQRNQPMITNQQKSLRSMGNGGRKSSIKANVKKKNSSSRLASPKTASVNRSSRKLNINK